MKTWLESGGLDFLPFGSRLSFWIISFLLIATLDISDILVNLVKTLNLILFFEKYCNIKYSYK